MNRFQKLATATAATTILLFAVGGLVRGTGSGLGCSTWPACEPGRLFPSGTVHSLIEFSHRALAFAVVLLTFATAVVARREHRGETRVVGPAYAAVALVLAQAALGAVVVATELDPWWVTAHFVAALALIADVIAVAVAAAVAGGRAPWDARGEAESVGFGEAAAYRSARAYAGLVAATAGVTGLLLLAGTYVRARGPQVGLSFTDWPLMDGRLIPTLNSVTTPMFVHRALALTAFALALWAMIRARVMQPRHRAFVLLSTLGVALFVAQILVGAANVLTRMRPWAVVLHVAFSVLVWSTYVALAAISWHGSGGRRGGPSGASSAREEVDMPHAGEPSTTSFRDTVGAYVALTKPRIVVLLLITTVPAMFLAQRGIPSLWLIVATLVGGTLAAGSANAVNMYLDRDIDEIMRRTRRRPLPAHAVTPDDALRFGFVLGAVSFAFLASAVNVLAASLSLSAIAFYVFVYTMWLKRTTTQNIVIGGAAGAVPALVGWAAVTGTVGLPAWVLFAIVFVWTPPHFWALAMRFSGDYAAAGVPMLPVVRGDDETRRQIFLYSLVLFGTTLALVPAASMGPVYVATAVVLGGIFVYRSLVLWRTPSDGRSWSLFKYSIVYLAALFGAVAVDALVA